MRERQPRLLFLAYGFPPINTIGCVRAYNMAKWLTRKGWEVTVVTPEERRRTRSDIDLHEELSRQGVRCMRTSHRWRSLLPTQKDSVESLVHWMVGGMSRRIAASLGIEREAGWIADAARACAGLSPDDVDVILASGSPFASFGLAKRLGERLGRPYVLDYRDLWTGNPHARRPASRRSELEERKVLAASAAAIGVSASLCESLRVRFGIQSRPQIISNGFDPDELALIPRQDFETFSIVYTGAFYPPKRGVEPLMAALRKVNLLDKNRPWAFHYYGYQRDYVLNAARHFDLEQRVVIHGNVPRAEALAAVRGSNISVVISSVYEQASLEDKGIVTGKIFDAIGLSTRLLVVAPEGSDLEGVVSLTGLGKRFAGTEIDQMAAFLLQTMGGGVPLHCRPEAFSWASLVEQLDGVLRGVLAAKG